MHSRGAVMYSERMMIPPIVTGASPWGQIQHVETIADGLVWVSTASHGGVWVRPDLEALIPADCQTIARQYAPSGWYEEDCDCCIPLALLPGVPAREREYAQRMVRTRYRFRPVALLLDGLKEQAARIDACPSRDGMAGDRHVWRGGACVFCGEAEDRGAASWLAENKATIDDANAKSRADAGIDDAEQTFMGHPIVGMGQVGDRRQV